MNKTIKLPETIEDFQRLLTAKKIVSSRWSARMKATDALIKKITENIWRQSYPRKKKINYDLLGEIPRYKALIGALEERKIPSKAYDYWNSKVLKIEDRLMGIAKNLDIPASADFVLFDSASSTNWSSQGYGAQRYARNWAEDKADAARNYGLEVEIRETNPVSGKDAYGHSYSYSTLEVWVKTTNIGVEILKRKPLIPLIEEVRRSWARGANIRVKMPFLPHGYEEENGIDFFGRVVDEEKYQKALNA